jgi:hypothetical protein
LPLHRPVVLHSPIKKAPGLGAFHFTVIALRSPPKQLRLGANKTAYEYDGKEANRNRAGRHTKITFLLRW